MVDRDKAKELAIAYINTLDLKGFRYEYVGVSSNERRVDEWAVIFDTYTPLDSLMDGPAIFLVDKKTGLVRNFNSD